MDHGLARSINRDETIESPFGVGNLIRSFVSSDWREATPHMPDGGKGV